VLGLLVALFVVGRWLGWEAAVVAGVGGSLLALVLSIEDHHPQTRP
jgi:hypothetical protein